MKYLILILLFNVSVTAQNRYALLIDKCYHKDVINLIQKQVGIKELKPNRSIMIDRYNKSVNNRLGSAYCAAGIYYCYETVNPELNPLMKTGLARNVYNHAKRNGVKGGLIGRGDMIVWQKGKTIFGHVETVISVLNGGWVQTVGFNTSDGNVANGDGVYYRKRHLLNPIQSLLILGYAGFRYE
jgi:hypothetical protein